MVLCYYFDYKKTAYPTNVPCYIPRVIFRSESKLFKIAERNDGVEDQSAERKTLKLLDFLKYIFLPFLIQNVLHNQSSCA